MVKIKASHRERWSSIDNIPTPELNMSPRIGDDIVNISTPAYVEDYTERKNYQVRKSTLNLHEMLSEQ